MKVEQFVMAYEAEQDRIRAILPEGFCSLRPVLRINAEIRTNEEKLQEGERVYIELNTPVESCGKKGWLNIGYWESPETEISYRREGKATVFSAPFLRITYTGVGIEGGCPAEKDNEGCFFPAGPKRFVAAEEIKQNKEFCNCRFKWKFSEESAGGVSTDGKSIPALWTKPEKQYARQEFSPQNAAAIPCVQVLGAYKVEFER